MSDPLTPGLGFGLGVRPVHYEELLGKRRGSVDWLEALTENYLGLGGRPLSYLFKLREHYPIALHGVSMSIGSTDGLNIDYLQQVRALADRIEASWISDHLCWTGVDGINVHDLLPVPFTTESLHHIARRIDHVQNVLGRRLVLENVSSYLAFEDGDLSEADFLADLAVRSDCLLLLDVNNVYVSSVNHGFDAHAYIDRMPVDRVQQLHLAGHSRQGELLIDTHDAPVAEPVWNLYAHALERFGPATTMIERDDRIPALEELLTELEQARTIARSVQTRAA